MIIGKGLTKEFGAGSSAFTAVSDISFEVREGSLVCLLGPSGCGKTTTLRLIAGLERPTRGKLEIDGIPTFSSRRNVFLPVHKRPIGMVFQSYAIWPHMNVANNVAYPLRVQRTRPAKTEERDRVLEALDLVGLTAFADHSATTLSGGQQQRVALARALVRRPKILLLDEPLSNLDAELRGRMRDEIKALQQKLGITTVLVTHDQAEAVAIADEIFVMDHGRIIERGAPQEIYRRPRSAFTAQFLGFSNTFTGTILGATQSNTIVQTGAGILSGRVLEGGGVGNEVTVLMRSEAFGLSREPQGDSAWPGRIVLATYHGESWSYQVNVVGQLVSVRTPDLDLEFKEGDPVFLEPSPGAAVIVDASTLDRDPALVETLLA